MDDETCVWTVVVGAGSGQRFGGHKLDAILTKPSTTVLQTSVERAKAASDGVVVVVAQGRLGHHEAPSPGVHFVAGGRTRSESVRSGLAAVPAEANIILVHDAARPLAGPSLFKRVIAAVQAGAAVAVPVVAVVDTIRSVDGVAVDRDALRAVQTPQGFQAAILREIHSADNEATDDASLAEAIGHEVVLVEGDVRNLKITRPADIEMARVLQQQDQQEE